MEYIFVTLIFMSLLLFIILKNKRQPLILFLITILALMIFYPNISLNAAREGINLWLFVVIPSLIPFFIINDILICLRVPDNIARLFAPIAKILFNTSGYGAYVFIMSIFSGYPAGARIASQLVENNKITSREGLKILTFSSTSGPLFIIGAVGSGMLKSTTAGYILFFAHLLGAVINGIILRFFFPNEKEIVSIPRARTEKTPSIGDMLSKAIASTLITCGYIGGYIILFSVLIALFNKIGLFKLLTVFISSFMFIRAELAQTLTSVLETSLEISNGCKIISLLDIDLGMKLIMTSFIIAFSGFSIIGQAISIINKTTISLKGYFFSKISHGIFSALACFLLLQLGNFSLQTASIPGLSKLFSPPVLLEALLVILLLLNILGTKKTKKNRVL